MEGGKFKVHTEITQSEVDNNFAGNSTKSHTFVADRQPKKVAINTYKEILER